MLLHVVPILLGPLVHILLQVALMHDIDTSVEAFPGTAIDLLLLHFDFLVQTLNGSLKSTIFLLHLHESAILHRDVLVGLASLPEIPCVEKLLLPSSDDQVTKVLVYHHGVALLDALPLVEILGNLSIDHVLDGIDASLASRANGLLSLALDRLVQAFDGWCTVTFERLSHQDELLFFLTDTKSIKALLKKCPITVLFEAKYCHASGHHVLLILNGLFPRLHKRP